MTCVIDSPVKWSRPGPAGSARRAIRIVNDAHHRWRNPKNPNGAITVNSHPVIAFFLFLNAFFVASEFAIVKVRPSQLEAEGQADSTKLKTALHVVNHLDGYLSANQLGITIASLALGFLGEPFVEALVAPLLLMTGISVWWVKFISFALAIISFTFLHVVIGELMPKSIAIRRSVPTTLALAGPLHAFYRSAHWAIIVLNGFYTLGPDSKPRDGVR